MKLPHEFYQLPYCFDVPKLIEEIEQFNEFDWISHHEGFQGNSAIPLISVNGEFNNDFKGPMRPTSVLDKCPYIQQILASFGEVLSRSRLMRLAPGAQVPLHSDINYHWYKRVRVHIPITTTEQVQFFCHDKQVHMGAGECWIFDSWKLHKVENNSDQYRVHLVVDLAGSSHFWQTIFQHSRSIVNDSDDFNCEFTSYKPNLTPSFKTEQFNAPVIMPVTEVEFLCNELITEIKGNTQNSAEEVHDFSSVLANFIADWRVLWSQFECNQAGWPHYHALREQVMGKALQCGKTLQLMYSGAAVKAFEQLVIVACMNIELREQQPPRNRALMPPSKSQPAPIPHKKDKEGESGQQVITAPLSRNSPCPCGSGKRYKACHGKVN
ncbi:aspartyl/asparaginyl beta-hydroxylase domain-containing protein [Shewanella sp. TC10]|uniref:aspartyl/asparaginyl beta-hydroxylase domain-containing protein n=1 Tax=Shewanella sp. TC10 TaxID=1419739 RepID=UPI00129EF6F6|nr:aspartyl/asparaginyl beta-hydroxylase domain-containing protein [Shewanella sp. TC10]